MAAAGSGAAKPPARPRVVLDSGALIHHFDQGRFVDHELVTVPGVVEEIRDAETRAKVALLPLVTRDAPVDARRTVVAFAKKTGDIASLSAVDLDVLALTYALEVEANGMANVHLDPAPPKVVRRGHRRPQRDAAQADVATGDAVATQTASASGAVVPDSLASTTRALLPPAVPAAAAPLDAPVGDGCVSPEDDETGAGWSTVPSRHHLPKPRRGRKSLESETAPVFAPAAPCAAAAQENAAVCPAPAAPVAATPPTDVGAASAAAQVEKAPVVLVQLPEAHSAEPGVAPADGKQDAAVLSRDDDDGKGWITPENFHLFSQGLKLGHDAQVKSSVSVMTSDFAVQNVALQLGLQLIAAGGQRVTSVKSFVLKCESCFEIVKDTTRQFCPHCGNHTLKKVSYVVRTDGALQVQRRSKVNLRGTQYSIPVPKGGRKAHDLILSEDVLKEEMRKAHIKPAGEVDPIAHFLGHPRPQEQVQVGYGRHNPNEPKHLTGRKKKKNRRE